MIVKLNNLIDFCDEVINNVDADIKSYHDEIDAIKNQS